MLDKYIIDGGNVVRVVQVDSWLVPCSVVYDTEDYVAYDTREDARYHNFLNELDKGKTLDDFKSSRYYQYYIERLKKDNEEYLI